MEMEPARAQQDELLSAEIAALRRQLADCNLQLANLQKASGDLLQQAEAAAKAERERSREVVLLTNLLAREEERHGELADRLVWSAAVHEMLLEQSRWWPMLSAGKRRKRQLQRLKSAGLFDHDAYLRRYPDVQDSGMDALSHYLLHGLREGRSRSSDRTADRG